MKRKTGLFLDSFYYFSIKIFYGVRDRYFSWFRGMFELMMVASTSHFFPAVCFKNLDYLSGAVAFLHGAALPLYQGNYSTYHMHV